MVLEINLRALTNVRAKLEEAWAEDCGTARAIPWQLNNGAFRLGNWKGVAMAK